MVCLGVLWVLLVDDTVVGCEAVCLGVFCLLLVDGKRVRCESVVKRWGVSWFLLVDGGVLWLLLDLHGGISSSLLGDDVFSLLQNVGTCKRSSSKFLGEVVNVIEVSISVSACELVAQRAAA